MWPYRKEYSRRPRSLRTIFCSQMRTWSTPDSITSLVARAQRDNLDLVSLMARLRCSSLAERALVRHSCSSFSCSIRQSGSAAPRTGLRQLLAAGTWFAPKLWRGWGGIAAIRNELIDDCALAREIKRNGRIWLGLTQHTHSIRGNDGFGGVGHMISRTAFYQLRHSGWLMIATVLGMAITFSRRRLWSASADGRLFGEAQAWLIMSTAFWPTLRFYSRSPLWAPLLPLIAIFYMGATVHSAVRYWLSSGRGEWEGKADSRMQRPTWPASRPFQV